MKASTARLTTAARLRFRRARASCPSERPAISSAAAGGPTPITMPWRSVIADLRVKQAVGEIDQQVEEDDERPVEDDHAHHKRIVPVEGALDEIAADAGNA